MTDILCYSEVLSRSTSFGFVQALNKQFKSNFLLNNDNRFLGRWSGVIIENNQESSIGVVFYENNIVRFISDDGTEMFESSFYIKNEKIYFYHKEYDLSFAATYEINESKMKISFLKDDDGSMELDFLILTKE